MLYSFCSEGEYCTDGECPDGVIQGIDGNFYGTTEVGGANGTYDAGTVFQLTPSGTLTTLYSFCSQANCADGEGPAAGLTQGSDGNFYGTTYYGGANPNGIPGGPGAVFKLTPSGRLTTLYSFCSQTSVTDGELYCTDGQNPAARLIQGIDGNFYGVTPYGGANGSRNPNESDDYFGGTVFKITPSGTLATLYSFCSEPKCTDGSRPAAGVIQGSDGNFYGTTEEGGARRAGLTQAALAEKIGVTANTVARWERGEMRIGQPEIVETALEHRNELNMSAYDRTIQLGRERNVIALALLKCCVDYLLKFGRDAEFHATAVLGGMPVINMRSLTAMGLIEKVSASRRHLYYRMPDFEGIERALRDLNVPIG